ncbi:glucosaminidase domain-containing protein [Bacillus sp. CLL-7-23]|uniref:Glucosaminidase domain-containing protein n=1 Tax=Bacillus changyiensis TaxID=3004103 RepID=A0ABT4WZL4_9BACI|nr:glucosaminidase domain-containing protein [Bacillus changyiensis]MDA7025470.1 glucosaminidase domain-containing protein [Bacillus changyiensis]
MFKQIKTFSLFTVILLIIQMAVTANPSFASYTDTSVYKIDTSQVFLSESEAAKAVEKLKAETGWQAEYKVKSGTTYEIVTGDIEGESTAKNLLLQLGKETGLKGTYSPLGQSEPYAIAISNEFVGEAKAKELVSQFEKETGLKASYMITKQEPYVKVVSGVITGEEKAKSTLALFETATGLKGTYSPYGSGQSIVKLLSKEIDSQSKTKSLLLQLKKETALTGSVQSVKKQQIQYKIVTGTIKGEANVKNMLNQFKKQLKIQGSYQPVGQRELFYNVKSGYFKDNRSAKTAASQLKRSTGISSSVTKVRGKRYWILNMRNLNKQNLNKINAFFKKKKWRYAKTSAGKKQTTYRIVSSSLTDQYKLKKGIQFFKNKKVKASTPTAGRLTSYRYRIVSGETKEQNQISKGLNFFKKNGVTGTAAPTGKKVYSQFRLTSEAVFQEGEITKALGFFQTNGLQATTVKTGQFYGHYKLKSEASLSQEKLNQALAFFSARHITGETQLTGQSGYKLYKITTSPILSKTDLDKGVNFFKKNAISASYHTKTPELFSIIINEEFTGYSQAEAAVQKLKTNYGWPATIIKIKNGPQIMTTDYGVTLNDMIDKQMKVSPQTDSPAYVSLTYIDMTTQTVTADVLNVRSSPNTISTGNIIGQLKKGDKVNVISRENGWGKIRMNWRNASREEVERYVNPKNFTQDSQAYFQFLKLSETAGLNAAEVNEKILYNKGNLIGRGQAFINAAAQYRINELYLIAHALLETGNGTSALAKGTSYNGRIVYNMYGVGAYDSNPLYFGAKYAYEQGWFTPEAAIIGGAKFIGEKYIHHQTYQQDTLYKMRWSSNAIHQYATDVGWAYKQVGRMYSLYTLLDNYTLYYDIPVYR